MSWMAATRPNTELTAGHTAMLLLSGAIAFHLAYFFEYCSFLILLYLYSLASLARQPNSRRAFYFGLGAGLLAYAPQLGCFYAIFGLGGSALWLVLAFWIGLFGLLARLCLVSLGPRWTALLIPFIWTGLEYFRSELYYLRFSWLNAGYVFSEHVQTVPFRMLGVYGFGFFLMLAAATMHLLIQTTGRKSEATPSALRPAIAGGLLALCGLGLWTNLPLAQILDQRGNLPVAGIQMEFPSDPQVVAALDKLKATHPEASLLVLSEYTFTETLPELVKNWCRENERYLLVGGKDFLDPTNFFDTAFVIGPHGEVVFRQAKSVPIQFFKDGLPARQQRLWESPWGKIGICICYDLSYTRVTDRLVRLGAQALIVPTMDVVDWGKREHELHARIAPVRAAEYGLPIFRVASSGISQLVNERGMVIATAPFPGEQAMIAGRLRLAAAGRIPFDRFLASASVGITGLVVGRLALDSLKIKFGQKSINK